MAAELFSLCCLFRIMCDVDYNPVIIITSPSLSDSVPNVRRRLSW